MASKDRKYRLWYVPHDMSFRQRRRRFWDKFGEYQVVRANYNVKILRHRTGWYYSMNPDGSEETLHMKKKEALFGPPDSDTWENWSNVVPWDELPAIPDRCIERFSCPGPLIWSEIDRREREQAATQRTESQYQGVIETTDNTTYGQHRVESCKNDDVLDHRCNSLDPEQPSELGMPNVDEDVMPTTARDISVKSEDNTSEDENEAAKHTSVKPKPSHRKVEEPEKEPEEHGELKKQKKRKSEQAGEHRAKKMRTGEEEIERPDEQDSREKPEERKIGNKELEEKLRRKLEQKLKRKLGMKIEEKLRRKLEQKLERKLGLKLEEKLEKKLKKKLEKRLEKQKQREAQGEAS
ncbi:hypothetical protein N7497_006052 [Penicillium chrysogenum]|nr:hypothetical protein N7497_006052 [Penicillium chrysogenum]